jgi:hypothetical protein
MTTNFTRVVAASIVRIIQKEFDTMNRGEL